ncbi:MAG: spermidine/putrescine ABC transporter substrate-binding protein [Deltaproteobacteria bacterium]|nr:spermidine/putrescine ABC transporter substrate-binding protein [Deltaproteobacteria bacterium]MBI3293450.1 spermidine/putrescine ABC transporter substrate-binding protein [Deltaproteobacteria bacterium]
MGSQKFITLVAAVVIAVGGFLFVRGRHQSDVLRVVTWSNYLPESSLAKFTQETGIRVELSYISSNEELLAKLKAGVTGYDVIQPSDYMVRQMVGLGMLAPLDHSLLKNLIHIDSYYRDLPYDKGFKFSIPFNWGTTGIAINSEKVNVGENVGWDILFKSPDPKHTSFLDDMREVFAAAFRRKGKSVNSTDPASLEEARATIAQARSQILVFTSEPKPLLLSGEVNIAHIYSVDGLAAAAENPKIKYFIPKEGGVVWTDNLAIPKASARVADAHRFIEFFLDPENALVVVKDKWLASPNKEVVARIPDGERKNKGLYPPDDVKRGLTFLEDIGETLLQLNRLWTDLKSS